jgi:ribosome-associated translation inhibitor RaiA
MQVQVNTDRSLSVEDVPAADVQSAIETAVARFSHRITRVEVHLSDQNSHKRGRNDKRCVIEARLAGLDPVAVTHEADTSSLAIDGAVEKLERSLDSRLGRLNSR